METTDISKNVSFTGHRSGRISQPMLTLFAGMVTEIKSLYASGCRNFFSGMAEGGDLVFAKAVLMARNELTDIRLVAAIPFREQFARYSDMNKRLYISLLEEADKTVVLSESYHKGCFHRRNDFLVEHAATMLAYWDGQPYGGTYYTVKKAIEAGKKIVNLYKLNHYETVQQDCRTAVQVL